MPRPNKFCELGASMQLIVDAGINCIVSLLETQEAKELGLADEQTLAKQHQIEFVSVPVADLQLPQSEQEFALQSKRIHKSISEGKNTLVHCRSGVGRTGMLCAAILAHSGCSVKEVITKISTQRGMQVPDTPEQLQWLTQNWSVFS